jgi:hypothetical protein
MSSPGLVSSVAVTRPPILVVPVLVVSVRFAGVATAVGSSMMPAAIVRSAS